MESKATGVADPDELAYQPDYIIDRTWDGRRLTKAEQNRMCGNSVSPYPVEAMVTANYQPNVAAAAA